jgi:hypothetical protein
VKPWMWLIPIVMMLSQGVGEACSCPPERTPAEALAIADAVFQGTIVDQRAVLLKGDPLCGGPGIKYDVIVKRAWKGVSEHRVSLLRPGVCSPSFQVGSTALIYAARHDGELFAQSCLPTRYTSDVEADVAQFGSPPIFTFDGPVTPVATSLPVSRWIRAHAVAGIWVFQSLYAWWPDINPTWDLRLLCGGFVVQVLAVFVLLARRRWRRAAWGLASSAATAVVTIFWAGHTLLTIDGGWYEPFLTW